MFNVNDICLRFYREMLKSVLKVSKINRKYFRFHLYRIFKYILFNVLSNLSFGLRLVQRYIINMLIDNIYLIISEK